MDVEPLKELIRTYVREEDIKKSPIELFILTFNVDHMKELDLNLKEVGEGMMQDYLLASAYIFPLFKNEKIDGKRFIDGGAINNVPLGSLIERDYKDIIVIRIFGIGREKPVKIPEDTNVVTIAPRVHLGNMLDFDAEKSRRNMKIGYYDAKRVIYGLAGKIYYIEENHEECYYLEQLLEIPHISYEGLTASYHLSPKPRDSPADPDGSGLFRHWRSNSSWGNTGHTGNCIWQCWKPRQNCARFRNTASIRWKS